MIKAFTDRGIERYLLPYVLLLVTGVTIALMLPLAKVAIGKGIDPLAYAFWQAMGAGLILLMAQALRGKRRFKIYKRYFLVSGLTAITIPNAIAFTITVEIGAAATSVYYALPSLVTYALALMLKTEKLQGVRILGLFVSVAGCVWVLLASSPVELNAGNVHNMLLGLLIPVSLGMGNVYRSLAWPKHATADQLAPGMLLSGALSILAYLVWEGRLAELWISHIDIALILLVQTFITAQSYLWFFKLQKIASPVFISQLGFVIIPTGVIAGVMFLGEQVGSGFILGISVVFVGMWLANQRSVLNNAPACHSTSDNGLVIKRADR